jgi:hypothetical protein
LEQRCRDGGDVGTRHVGSGSEVGGPSPLGDAKKRCLVSCISRERVAALLAG